MSNNVYSKFQETGYMSRLFPGALLIGFLSLYELYIAFSNTMFGEKDFLSKEFFFFFLIIYLFLTTNFTTVIYEFLVKFSSIPLILFIIYFFISALISEEGVMLEYINQLIFYLPVSFLSGFISFTIFTTKLKFQIRLNNYLYHFALIFALSYLILSVVILFSFLSTLDSRFIQIATETNIYYQDFGDAYIKATICFFVLLVLHFKLKVNYNQLYLRMVTIIIILTFIAVVNLVLIGSNKGTSVIVLLSSFIIFYLKPKNWLFRSYYLNKRIIFLIPVIMFISFGIIYLLSEVDITKTRLFDYGESGSIVSNSSFTSRFDQYTRGEGQMLFENIFFGKLTIIYLHSSIASLQTHLGLIGSFLLWFFVSLRIFTLYSKEGKVVLRSITIPILMIAAISSFFTWDLLWFYFGALSTNYRNNLNII